MSCQPPHKTSSLKQLAQQQAAAQSASGRRIARRRQRLSGLHIQVPLLIQLLAQGMLGGPGHVLHESLSRNGGGSDARLNDALATAWLLRAAHGFEAVSWPTGHKGRERKCAPRTGRSPSSAAAASTHAVRSQP